MGYPIAELQERMSSQEFSEWVAYSRIEPWGWEMDNWRAAMIAAEISNAIHRTIPLAKGAKRPKPLAPSDFYPVVRSSADQPQLSPSQAEYLRKKHAKRRHHNR
jgi:hypothetical protein